MRFRTTSLFMSLLAFVSVSAVAAETQEYDLTCAYNATATSGVTFRLNGRYIVNEDGSALLEGVNGLLFDDPGLMTLEVYDAKGDKDTLKSDPSYKPKKGGKWEEHVKFELDKNVGPTMLSSSGGTNELFLGLEPTSEKKNRRSVPNPGYEYKSKFHAGLQYYLGDVGNRIELTCEGYRYVSDRELKKKGE